MFDFVVLEVWLYSRFDFKVHCVCPCSECVRLTVLTGLLISQNFTSQRDCPVWYKVIKKTSFNFGITPHPLAALKCIHPSFKGSGIHLSVSESLCLLEQWDKSHVLVFYFMLVFLQSIFCIFSFDVMITCYDSWRLIVCVENSDFKGLKVKVFTCKLNTVHRLIAFNNFFFSALN